MLQSRGPEYTFGTTDCAYGYEGNVNDLDQFTTCHQTIYYPTARDRESEGLMIGFTVFGVFLIIFYYIASTRLRRKFLLAKIERRKTKRSSEDSLSIGGGGSGSMRERGSSSFVGSSSFSAKR